MEEHMSAASTKGTDSSLLSDFPSPWREGGLCCKNYEGHKESVSDPLNLS